MNKFTTIARPEADGTIHIPVPEELKGAKIKLEISMEPLAREQPQKAFEFGCMPGIWMSDDFDEPLEDFKDYM
jgi:hypothetical protein